ncbi:uncharacterized protein isoform X2 [Leptinotarsa decemlineata]|uniref:uncharacterized protein isoform X2 n=1 Tax=Leptinotarsa decemlineata TaxID=7539 RepID=UPI003D30CC69
MEHLLLMLVLGSILTAQRSFVDTAPLSQEIPKNEDRASEEFQDGSVQELENLKKSIVKADGEILGKMNQHIERTFEKGKPNTKVKTEIEIPSQGVHQTLIQPAPDEMTNNGNRRSPINLNIPTDSEGNSIERSDSASGVQYSALDIAEYVFWTGDEKGVTSAIEEFLQAGLMSREEAIGFLQEIKYNLDNLKSHYTQLGLNSLQQPKVQEILPKQQDINEKTEYSEKPELRSNFNINQLRQKADKKRIVEDTHSLTVDKNIGNDKVIEDDYDELLERLRLADFLYTEYSLEEVIYQLAKVMFTQSLTRGSAEAQEALQKFTNFLELEAAQGHISRALEKKVLDVLIASLSDTLTEHPELLAAARQSMGPTASNAQGQNFIRKILNSNLDEPSTSRDTYPFKDQNKLKQFPELMKKNKNLTNYLPFDFSKYKL